MIISNQNGGIAFEGGPHTAPSTFNLRHNTGSRPNRDTKDSGQIGSELRLRPDGTIGAAASQIPSLEFRV